MAINSPALLSSAAVDVTGVFTKNFTQIFSAARPMKASVRPSSKLMEHPIETGATTTDHRILLPIEIELSMILNSADYRNVYQQIAQVYNSAELLIVQTKASVFKNQIIAEMPHEEDPEMFDAIIVALKLKEVQFANTQVSTISPKNAANSSNVNRGNQQPNPLQPNSPKRTAAQKYFGGLIK
jgi:hypothetical protein